MRQQPPSRHGPAACTPLRRATRTCLGSPCASCKAFPVPHLALLPSQRRKPHLSPPASSPLRGTSSPAAPPPEEVDDTQPTDLTRGWQRLASRAVNSQAAASLARRLDASSRAVPLERAAARVCREAGATVATNVLLCDLNLVVEQQDDRRIEVIANGLPLWGGAQLAVTLVSALDSAGQPRRHQRSTSGAALRVARRAKEHTYPELLLSARCRLVVVGLELGGRWSSEAVQFIRLLARSRALSAPAFLRAGATAADVSR